MLDRLGLQDKLEPVQVLGEQQVSMANLSTEFKNLWDCIYHLKAAEVRASLLYIRDEATLCRCVRASMRGITYTSEDLPGLEQPINAGECWGLPIFRQLDDDWMESILYYQELLFENEEELQADMGNPHPIDFGGYWQDVFADG